MRKTALSLETSKSCRYNNTTCVIALHATRQLRLTLILRGLLLFLRRYCPKVKDNVWSVRSVHIIALRVLTVPLSSLLKIEIGGSTSAEIWTLCTSAPETDLHDVIVASLQCFAKMSSAPFKSRKLTLAEKLSAAGLLA
jgi:hypothetical protein